MCIQVYGLDTGAGEILFKSPVTIGYVVHDREGEGEVCDDSCDFAFDGVCDDGSENEYISSSSSTKSGHHDDYDDEHAELVCAKGTDCTDCGGRPLCSCMFARQELLMFQGWIRIPGLFYTMIALPVVL